jgi:hypothetical protein
MNWIKEIEVSNSFGEVVFRAKTDRGSFQIDLSSIPSGVYFLKIENQTQRIIKQ